MFPVQNGLICWLDAMDGKAGDTLLKDRTSYGHNLIVENFQQGYGFTGTSIKVKQSKSGTSNNNALYIANGGFKTSCKSFCICIERHNTNQPWYIFDGRGLDGQGLSTNHCFNGNTGSSYDNSKTRRDGVLTYNNSNLDINKKTFLYFELKEAELFTLSILMRFSKNENTEGEFYSLYAYNRALTEEEILQNMEYENNKISYVNENNLPKIVDKLSNASNIKITGNKYGNRVQTVIDKIVEKADNVTKAIEQEVNNNSYSFKVGQGNNVDITSDVQDSFSNLAIKGVTYQNLFNNFSMSQDATNYITVNQKTIKWTKSVITSGNVNIKYHNALVELNGVYTLVFYVYKNTLKRDNQGDSYNVAKFNIVSYNSGNYMLPVNYTGLVKVKLQQPSTTPSDGKPYFEVYKDAVGELEISYPILLKGDYTNNLNLPSYFEGIIGVGDKSKNLFNKHTIVNNKTVNSITGELNNNSSASCSDFIEVSNGKQYIINGRSANVGAYYNANKSFISSFNGNNLSIPSECKYIRFNINNADNIDAIQLEEGSTATSYEPYYNGHKIEILSNGNNLFNRNEVNFNRLYIPEISTGGEGVFANATGLRCFTIEVVQNTQYCVSIGFPIGNFRVFASYDYPQANVKAKCLMATGGTSISFNTENYQYITVVYYSYNNDNQSGKTEEEVIQTIQLELGTTKSSYESYKEDKKQILLDEPLIRLPNGVYDEITKDHKLIRRIGKIVLDENKNSWNYWDQFESDTHISFYNNVSASSGLPNYPQIAFGSTVASGALCNNFTWEDTVLNVNGTKVGFIIRNASPNYIAIRLEKSTLGITSNMIRNEIIDKLSQWLKSNPIVLYYQLANPTITELPAPYLRIFKDGHLTFNTLVAPESSHVVQLNKSGQIQNAIKESQSLDNRINVLENNYDNLMLSTISRLNDLELDYTLK